MRTDHPFYQYMQRYPKQTFELLGLSDLPSEHYSFEAVDVKEIQFHIDGVYLPDQPDLPVLFIEVYFYVEPRAYLKLITETLMYISRLDKRPKAKMFLVFGSQSLDLGDEMLDFFKQSPYLSVVYLDRALNHLPDNPYHTLLRLMVNPYDEASDLRLFQAAVNELKLTDTPYLQACMTFLLAKYNQLNYNEIKAMFDHSRPLDLSQNVSVREYAQEYAQEYSDKILLQRAQNIARETEFSAEKIAHLLGLPVESVREALRNMS